MRTVTQFFLSLHSLAHSHPLILCEWLITCVVFVSHTLVLFFLADMECADVPLLTPSSKEMMSQALKATFSGFTKEQQRLGIPKGILFTVGKGATQARVLGKALALPQLGWLRVAPLESAVAIADIREIQGLRIHPLPACHHHLGLRTVFLDLSVHLTLWISENFQLGPSLEHCNLNRC